MSAYGVKEGQSGCKRWSDRGRDFRKEEKGGFRKLTVVHDHQRAKVE